MGGLLDTSLIVSYSPSISKLDALEAHLSGGSLESWGRRCEVQALCSWGRSWESGVPSSMSQHWVGGWWPVCLSHPFQGGSLLILLMCRHISVFLDFFRGNCSLVAVDSVYSSEVSSGTSYFATLNQNLKLLLTFKNGRKWVVRVWKCH